VNFRVFKDFLQKSKEVATMPRGGARPGAGRPRKPLADKLIEGNPSKRELTVVKIGGVAQKSKPGEPKESKKSNARKSKLPTYLDVAAKEGGDILPPASEIYAMLTDWIEAAGCADIVGQGLVEDFAFLRRAYLECEYMNRKLGRIASGRRSPYVNMALDYQKAMMAVWNQIWLTVSQNNETRYEGRNEFLAMLTNRGF
jgi:hypothetical protein